MKKISNPQDDIKTDLRHDTMDFSATTEGDDKLDLDDFRKEEDAISSEELDALEEDSEDSIAAALNAAESDRMADEDYLPEESDEDDYYDNEEITEEEKEERI